MEKHDVLIIGGGPSGATLAHFLKEMNIDSVVVERANHFRDKTCAGALPKGIFNILPEEVKNSFAYVSYRKFRVFYKGNLAVESSFDEPFAFGVMRSEFDEALRNGLDVRYEETFQNFEEEKDKVIVKTSKNEYAAKFLVGADGVGSKVSILTGLNRKTKIIIAEEKELPKKLNEESLNVYLGNNFLGYGWKFDKLNCTSVGAGSLKKYFKKGISNAVDGEEAKIKTYPISLWDGDMMLSKGRVVLVGEAGSIVDPFSAAGIYHSILSSRLLSQVIYENLQAGASNFDKYIELLNGTIFEEFKYARILSSAFYPFLPVVKNVVFRKHILDFIVESQNGSGYLSYKRIFERFSSSKHFQTRFIRTLLKLARVN